MQKIRSNPLENNDNNKKGREGWEKLVILPSNKNLE